METKRFNQQEITEAAKILRQGGLVAFPSETVYGLGANATLEDAVKQVFIVKGRPSDNPLIVHVENFEQVKQYVDVFHPLTETIVEKFWPGPLTLIFKIKSDALPRVVSAGLSTVSFRMPDHPLTLALIKEVGAPLVGPSANTSGRPSPTQSEHVYHDLNGKIAGILEGGSTTIGVESTVLDISDPTQPPMILRPGAVTKEALEAALKVPILVDQHLVEESQAPRSPGMKYKHYAPKTTVWMVHSDDWQAAFDWATSNHFKIGVLASPTLQERFSNQMTAIYPLTDETVTAAAKGLFAGLRALDEEQVDLIFAPVFSETGLGVAYMNRLKKAANQHFFKP
ncbi:L-threonylcarbamoyladenylate synthase [Enterococcus alcedinis]|uniref:Threonylcarbamoyl-AMP synthase n=1 Tax=Enterococcus alcedinis TaxID=1274384 RepID=A0A917JG52_9ENTE|nr:L-threonylcarbamoyladenylate synthase [Enterococcus alcedinis]MBP2103106.1 L-threonylcarbamoyladenylate synthase [Enterococcus alcedinis]GGI66668.1 threonylcarbamoyl-AMP synthase [Enterococcus alcedinis]